MENAAMRASTDYDFVHSFSWALQWLKDGHKVAREGWNGRGIFIQLQTPDEYSKMTQPYIYIDTLGLKTNNPKAPKGRVPWFPSQTDLFAEDWAIVQDSLSDIVKQVTKESIRRA